MQLIQIGIHYLSSGVEVREKYSFVTPSLPNANEGLHHYPHITENVILSTCNRTEVYAVVDDLAKGIQSVIAFIADRFSVPFDVVEEIVHVKTTEQAIQHLFRVITGMDSMVLGETEILGQTKAAFFSAQQVGATGTICNALFKQAITLAKRVHHETVINTHALSVSHVAIQLGLQRMGETVPEKVVIVGAGTIGKQVVQHVLAYGMKQVILVNRSLSHAEAIAREYNVGLAGLSDLPDVLVEAELVVFATGTAGYLLHRDEMESIQSRRKGRPLLMIDLGVPRNVEPRINQLEHINLLDINHIEHHVAQNLTLRKDIAAGIEELIIKECELFNVWWQGLPVVPVIQALKKKMTDIQEEVNRSINRKIPTLSQAEQKVIHTHTMSIINQLLKAPIAQLKEMGRQGKAEDAVQFYTEIFDLEGVVADKARLKEKEEVK